MDDLRRRVSTLESNDKKRDIAIVSNKKEIERNIGGIKDLKDDRHEMKEVMSALNETLSSLNVTVAELKVHMSYERIETKGRKDFKSDIVKKIICWIGGVLGGGLVFLTILGLIEWIGKAK